MHSVLYSERFWVPYSGYFKTGFSVFLLYLNEISLVYTDVSLISTGDEKWISLLYGSASIIQTICGEGRQ